VNGDLRVGLDIGATKVLGAVVDAGGTVVAQSRQATRLGAEGVLATATAVLDSLTVSLDGVLPAHIGIGVCGIVDRDTGTVSHAVNLGIGEAFPLAALLAERTGATVAIENDVLAATWGAHVVSGTDDLAFLSVGTGLAAGFVLSGKLRRGAHGAAAEVGHLPVDPDGPRCSCGQRGCLELSASGSTLAAAWPGDGAVPPAAALFAAAAAGNQEAVTIRDRFAVRLAEAIRILELSVGPDAIIIGGGVSHVGEPLLAAVAAALRAQAAGSPFLTALDLAGRTRLLPGRQPVGAIGAALIGNAG
jgi:predicted NBD/HSP70 family sugar kinase